MYASVDTVSYQYESNYGISCKSVQSPRRPIAIQHNLHPSSLLPGHHSNNPSCMTRFARNGSQWNSIMIHCGHLPLDPAVWGTLQHFHPIPHCTAMWMGTPSHLSRFDRPGDRGEMPRQLQSRVGPTAAGCHQETHQLMADGLVCSGDEQSQLGWFNMFNGGISKENA